MPDTTNSGNPFNYKLDGDLHGELDEIKYKIELLSLAAEGIIWRADGGGVIDEDHAQAIDRAVTDLGLAFGNLRRRFETDAPAKQA